MSKLLLKAKSPLTPKMKFHKDRIAAHKKTLAGGAKPGSSDYWAAKDMIAHHTKMLGQLKQQRRSEPTHVGDVKVKVPGLGGKKRGVKVKKLAKLAKKKLVKAEKPPGVPAVIDHAKEAENHKSKMEYAQKKARMLPLQRKKYERSAKIHEAKMNFHLGEHKKKQGGV